MSVPDASDTNEPIIGIKFPAASLTERSANESVTVVTEFWKYNIAHIIPQIIEIILTIVLSAALFYPVIKLVKKNLITKNLDSPLNILPQEFAIKILPDYFLIIALVYFLLGEFESTLFSIDLLEIININGFLLKLSKFCSF